MPPLSPLLHAAATQQDQSVHQRFTINTHILRVIATRAHADSDTVTRAHSFMHEDVGQTYCKHTAVCIFKAEYALAHGIVCRAGLHHPFVKALT